MTFDISIFVKRVTELLPFLGTTFAVMLLTLLFSLLLGMVTAMGSLGRHRIWRTLAGTYILLMRCVPPIVLLFVVYYGSPYLLEGLFGLRINGLAAVYYAIFSLSLLHGASFAEMMRGAYQSVEKGQREAAVSIGLSEVQAFHRIVLPQAFVTAIPNLGNALIGILKDGALAYSIGVVDVTGRASYLISMNMGGYVLETYLALALIYWSLSILTQRGFTIWEHRLRNISEGR